jgi:hypothetical protein
VVVDDQVVACARQELRERHLIIVIRLEPELATVMTVWKNRLIEFADVERLPEILRKAGANRPHEMAVHPVEVVHPGCWSLVAGFWFSALTRN